MRWIYVAVLCMLLLAGCQTVSQEKAQAMARVFIASQVKLFAKTNETMNTNVSDSGILLVSQQEKDHGFEFTYNMTGLVDGAQRSAMVTVTVSKKGDVIALNGQPIPTNGKSTRP